MNKRFFWRILDKRFFWRSLQKTGEIYYVQLQTRTSLGTCTLFNWDVPACAFMTTYVHSAQLLLSLSLSLSLSISLPSLYLSLTSSQCIALFLVSTLSISLFFLSLSYLGPISLSLSLISVLSLSSLPLFYILSLSLLLQPAFSLISPFSLSSFYLLILSLFHFFLSFNFFLKLKRTFWRRSTRY